MKSMVTILAIAMLIAFATAKAVRRQPKHTADFLTFWDLHKVIVFVIKLPFL